MKKLIIALVMPLFSACTQDAALALDEPVKEPNVSGSFYPSDASKLSSMIEQMIAKASPRETEDHIYGIIAPHAGYIYSGSIAASAYKAIYRKNYSTVIILSPSHYHNLQKASVYKGGSFKTPLGLVPVDSIFTDELLKNSRHFEYRPEVFEKEHALEVQIPFLQKSLNSFSIVPIIISESSFQFYEEISDILAQIISQRDDVLIVASTDMSHFHNQKKANAIDKTTLSFIADNDAQALFNNLSTGECELCGRAAVITLMLTMRKIGAEHAQFWLMPHPQTRQTHQLIGSLATAAFFTQNHQKKHGKQFQKEASRC